MFYKPALKAGPFGAPRTIFAQLAALLVRLLLKRMDLVHDETWPVQQPEKRHCKQGAYHHGHPRPLPQSILTDEHTVGLYPIAYDQPIA
jgi:hypothetical protein